MPVPVSEIPDTEPETIAPDLPAAEDTSPPIQAPAPESDATPPTPAPSVQAVPPETVAMRRPLDELAVAESYDVPLPTEQEYRHAVTRAYANDLTPEEASGVVSTIDRYEQDAAARYQKQQIETVLRRFDDINTQGGRYDSNDDREIRALGYGDVEEYKAEKANIAYISATRGIPIEEVRNGYDGYKSELASALGINPEKVSSKQIYQSISEQKRNNQNRNANKEKILDGVSLAAVAAGIKRTGVSMGDLVDAEINNIGQDALKLSDEERKNLIKTGNQIQGYLDTNSDLLKKGFALVEAEKKGVPGAEQIREFVKELAAIPKEDQELMLNLFNAYVQRVYPEEKGVGKYFSNLFRSAGGMVRDAIDTSSRTQNERALAEIETSLGKSTAWYDPKQGYESLQHGSKDDVPASYVRLTDTKEARGWIAEQRSQLTLGRRVDDFLKGQIDPIRPMAGGLLGWAEKATYGVSASLPYMVAMSMGSYPVVYQAMRDQATDDLLRENPDMDRNDAMMLGTAIGAASTLIEALQTGQIAANVAKSLMRSTELPYILRRSLEHGFAMRAGEQFTEEMLQNSLAVGIKYAANKLGVDMENFDVMKDIKELGDSVFDVAGVSLFFAIPGSTVPGSKRFKKLEKAVNGADREKLYNLGFSNEQIDELKKTPQADRQKVAKEQWLDRDEEGRKRYYDNIRKNADELTVEEAARKAGDQIPRLIHFGEDVWGIQYTDGRMERVGSKDEAHAAARVAFDEWLNNQKYTNEDFFNYFKGALTGVEIEEAKNLDELVKEGFVTREQVEAHLRVAGLPSDNFEIQGYTKREIRDGMLKHTVALGKGKDPAAVLEEVAHVGYERALASGQIKYEDFRDAVKFFGRRNRKYNLDDPSMSAEQEQLIVREGIAAMTMAHFVKGKFKEMEQVKPGIWSWFQKTGRYLRDIFQNAYHLKKLKEEGKISEDIMSHFASVYANETPVEYTQGIADMANLLAGVSEKGVSFRITAKAAVNAEAFAASMDRLKRSPVEQLKLYERALTGLYKVRDMVAFKRAGEDPEVAAVQAAAFLDALVTVLPPEVRAKFKTSAFVKLSARKTGESRTKILTGVVDKVGNMLEQHIKDTYEDKIDKLLAKRKHPVGGAQDFLDQAKAAWDMTAEQADRRIEELKNSNDPDDAVLSQLISVVGGKEQMTASRLIGAYEHIFNQKTAAREKWNKAEEARKADIESRRNGGINTLGGTVTEFDRGEAEKTTKTLKNNVRGWVAQATSINTLLRQIYGTNSEIAKRFARKIRQGTTRYQDDVLAANYEFEAMINRAAKIEGEGLKGKLARQKIIAGLKEAKDLGITYREGRRTEEISVPINEARDAVLNGSDRYTSEEIDQMEEQLATVEEGSRRRVVRIEHVVDEGVEAKFRDVSKDQAINIRMWWAQEGPRKNLQKQGITQEIIDKLEKYTDDDLSANVIQFLRTFYDQQYHRINDVHKRMFGFSLPSVPLYSPVRVMISGANERDFEEVLGPHSGNGMSAGFLIARVPHSRKLDLGTGAIGSYFGHVRQTSWWARNAELVRELRSTFNTEMQDRIKTTYNVDVNSALTTLIDVVAGNGVRQAGPVTILEKAYSRIASALATSALGLNVRVMLAQLENVFRVTYAIPDPKRLAAAMARAATGNPMEQYKLINRSPALQRRIEAGITPEMRQVFDRTHTNPSILPILGEYTMMPMIQTDAKSLASSALVVYYDALNTLDEQHPGWTTEQKDAEAMEAVEQFVFDYGQPNAPTQMSALQARGGVYLRTLFMFASDRIKKTEILLDLIRTMTTGREGNTTDRSAATMAAVNLLVVAFGTEALREAYAAWTSEDDDKREDWRIVSLRALLLAPVGGLPMAEEASDFLVNAFTGGKSYDRTHSFLMSGFKDVARTFSNPEDLYSSDPVVVSESWRRAARGFAQIAAPWPWAEKTAQGASLFSASLHGVEDSIKLVKQFIPEEEE